MPKQGSLIPAIAVMVLGTVLVVLAAHYFGTDNGGGADFLYYVFSKYHTATVQEVHDGPSGTFKLYMNDGTVWLAPREFSVIAQDQIRYKHKDDISKARFDGLDFCYLANVTRGSEMAAERIDGPTKATSCPANSNWNEEQAQTPIEHRSMEPVQTEAVGECRTRFWAKGIQEMDGKSVEAACKENPDRQPAQ
jgi:hypothetical protein